MHACMHASRENLLINNRLVAKLYLPIGVPADCLDLPADCSCLADREIFNPWNLNYLIICVDPYASMCFAFLQLPTHAHDAYVFPSSFSSADFTKTSWYLHRPISSSKSSCRCALASFSTIRTCSAFLIQSLLFIGRRSMSYCKESDARNLRGEK
jgi:hypothetical protein